MTAYAFLNDTLDDTYEVTPGIPFINPFTDASFPADWPTSVTQAEREALNCWPIVDDAEPGFEYTVTGSTLEITAGPVIERHWTTVAKTAEALRDEMVIEVTARQAFFAFDDFEYPIGSGGSPYNMYYSSNAVAQTAIALHGAAAAKAIADGAMAGDYNWLPGVTGFYWPNIFDDHTPFDAFQMVALAEALADYLRKLAFHWQAWVSALYVEEAANDIPAMLVIRDEYLVNSNWYVSVP